jgi:hypothetical protein
MTYLFTKQGRPLSRAGDDLYSRSGRHVARLRGVKAFGPDGRYVGTVVGDRLVYRATDSAAIGTIFVPSQRAGSAAGNRVPSAILGEEPPIAD